MKLLAVCILVTVTGCASLKVKAVEHYINSVSTGTWTKDGATRSDYYDANAACQQQTSHFDPEKGYVTDLEAYAACMREKGWKLTPPNVKLSCPNRPGRQRPNGAC